MDPTTTTDPINMLLTTGGGAGTGVVAYYLLTKVVRNGNGTGSTSAASDPDTVNALRDVAHKLDQTNELLQEMLRSQNRVEGMLTTSIMQQRNH